MFRQDSNLACITGGQTVLNEAEKNSKMDELDALMDEVWSEILESNEFFKIINSEPVDRRMLATYMLETYHYTRHNSRNQALVGSRSLEISNAYQKYCYQHAAEETGHEQMALHDIISSTGLRLREENLPPPLPETETLIAYLYWISLTGNPLARLGYSYWAEQVYVYVATPMQKIVEDLSLKPDQMTFFIAHAEIDIKHADEVRSVMFQQCKRPEDWVAVKRTLETSLRLTGGMLSGVVREFRKMRAGSSSPYQFLEQMQ